MVMAQQAAKNDATEVIERVVEGKGDGVKDWAYPVIQTKDSIP